MNDDGGLYVSPTLTGGYELKWFNAQEEDQFPCVEPDTWYDVEMVYDWTTALGHDTWTSTLRVDVVVKGDDGSGGRAHYSCQRLALSSVALYNFGPGVARYTAIEVDYSEKTSRDGHFVVYE